MTCYTVFLYQFSIFSEGFQNNISGVFTQMFLIFFRQIFHIDWFSIFKNNMCGFDLWHMCLKNLSSVIDRHWNNGTATLGGYFEASFMEREQFCFVRTFASGSFWEDADGNAGFDFFNSCKDGFQSLLDILAVKEKAVSG